MDVLPEIMERLEALEKKAGIRKDEPEESASAAKTPTSGVSTVATQSKTAVAGGSTR